MSDKIQKALDSLTFKNTAAIVIVKREKGKLNSYLVLNKPKGNELINVVEKIEERLDEIYEVLEKNGLIKYQDNTEKMYG